MDGDEENMKVAFCSSEVVPFAKTGGLADVCGALPLALENIGLEVILFLPRYSSITEEEYSIKKINEGVSQVIIGKNIKVYLVEHNDFFNREGLYGNEDGNYEDNLERFQFFCCKFLELLKNFDFKADIIHCHDWQTALIPVYLKEQYQTDDFYKETQCILTIHNLAYQGVFPAENYEKLNLKKELFTSDIFEFFKKVNVLKAGIVYSDEITTVSPQYAHEIQTREFGCGLEGVLHARDEKILGILNGLDYDVWNPETDSFIEKNYGAKNYRDNKSVNKRALQKFFNLPVCGEVPLFGFVGRLSHQKGIDVILEVLEEIGNLDIQVIIQGVGDGEYQDALNGLALRYPEKIGICLEFCEKTAHQIYAGSDLFLMPSLFEPCGLSQMISLCYGTIPIVFKTGGLADTIESFSVSTGKGNGFVFKKYTKNDFIRIIREAGDSFNNKEQFASLIQNAFESKFLWEKSAKAYKELYQCLLSASQEV